MSHRRGQRRRAPRLHEGGGVRAGLTAVALWAAFCAGSAQGQDLSPAERRAAASAAYTRGSEAYRGGDYVAAARWYETADELAPAANALIQAIRAHNRADNPLRAGTLALALVERYGEDRMRRHASTAEEAAPTALRIDVRCEEECELEIDGDPERFRSVFLTPDTQHTLVASFGTLRRVVTVSGPPGDRQEVVLTPPEPEPVVVEPPPGDTDTGHEGSGVRPQPDVPRDAPPEEGRGGMSPWVVIVGATLTAGAGATLIWSGLDTLDARDTYESMPTRARYDRGRDLELRTNILIGVTAGLGALTLALAIFATDWGGGSDEEADTTVEAAVLPEGGALVAVRRPLR